MFTYDPALAGAIDRVRFLVGDTDCAEPLLDDGEIEHLAAEYPEIYAAAWHAADAIAAKFARRVDRSTGRISKAAGSLFDHYSKLAEKLRAKAAARSTMAVSGISRSEKQSDASDSDLVAPSFRRGAFGEHETEHSSYYERLGYD